MIVFWWSGRGYLTALIVLATLSAFGIIQPAIYPIVGDSLLFWGVALFAAAALNWHFGTKANRKKLVVARPKTVKDRLLYRARHTFMTLPMETFSLVIAIFAVVTITYGLFHAG